MHKVHLHIGAVHIGIIILLLFALAAAFSVSISATNTTQGREIGINFRQALCRQSSESAFCQFNIMPPKPASSPAPNTPNTGQPRQDQSLSKSGPCFPQGDATGDGVVNDFDAQAIINHIAGTKLITLRFQNQADVNSDSAITATDATLIRQYLASRISTFPACR